MICIEITQPLVGRENNLLVSRTTTYSVLVVEVYLLKFISDELWPSAKDICPIVCRSVSSAFPFPLFTILRRYFQHAYFMPIVSVGKIGAYYLVHGDLPRQHSFGTILRFTGPVPADSRQ